MTPRTETHPLSPSNNQHPNYHSRTVLSKRVPSRTSSEFALFLNEFSALSALDFVGKVAKKFGFSELCEMSLGHEDWCGGHAVGRESLGECIGLVGRELWCVMVVVDAFNIRRWLHMRESN